MLMWGEPERRRRLVEEVTKSEMVRQRQKRGAYG